MVFNRNKMRILKPDFWKEHFPIQLFYRLFNHFSEFQNSEVPSDNVKNNRWARVKCPIFGPWKPANVYVPPILNLPILISFSDDDFFCFWVLSLIRLFKNSKYYIWCNSPILFVFLEVASFGRRPFLPIIIVLHFFSTSWKIIRKSKKSPAEFSIFHAYSRLVMNKRKLTVFNGTKFKCISLSLEHAMAFKDDLPIILNFKTENLPSARKEENSSKRRLNLNSRSERLPEPSLTIQGALNELDLG